MTSKPSLVHSTTALLAPHEIAPRTPPMQMSQTLQASSQMSPAGSQARSQSSATSQTSTPNTSPAQPSKKDAQPVWQGKRPRTHTWPLPKAEKDLVEQPLGPYTLLPSMPNSPTQAAAPQEPHLPPPRRNLQVMLERLDRDMANCPYYEVYPIDSWL